MAVAVNLFEAEQSLVSGVCRKHTGMHTCMYTPEYMHAHYTQTRTHGYTHTCVRVCVCDSTGSKFKQVQRDCRPKSI